MNANTSHQQTKNNFQVQFWYLIVNLPAGWLAEVGEAAVALPIIPPPEEASEIDRTLKCFTRRSWAHNTCAIRKKWCITMGENVIECSTRKERAQACTKLEK